jgi:hypothetical protein
MGISLERECTRGAPSRAQAVRQGIRFERGQIIDVISGVTPLCAKPAQGASYVQPLRTESRS